MRKTGVLMVGFALLAALSVEAGIGDGEITTPRAKVALIIGQQRYDYDSWPQWLSSRTDAIGMAERLAMLGFETTLELNLTRRGMERALDRFEDRLERGAVGLIYYSGHGIQSGDGFDYLIPVDVPVPEGDADLRAGAVRVSDIEGRISRHGDRLIIMLLDMSRNAVGDQANAIQWDLRPSSADGNQSAARESIRGSAILFAAAPGRVAMEMGEHSVLTAEMLKVLEESPVSLSDLFSKVGLAVSQRTDGRQTPWRIVSLRGVGEFYFSTE